METDFLLTGQSLTLCIMASEYCRLRNHIIDARCNLNIIYIWSDLLSLLSLNYKFEILFGQNIKVVFHLLEIFNFEKSEVFFHLKKLGRLPFLKKIRLSSIFEIIDVFQFWGNKVVFHLLKIKVVFHLKTIEVVFHLKKWIEVVFHFWREKNWSRLPFA